MFLFEIVKKNYNISAAGDSTIQHILIVTLHYFL